ncbi:MAG: hypothetical protein JNL83_15400 [Myxococcales bacterium]|nr:hypothetical protein [Myxococcales bacterium]
MRRAILVLVMVTLAVRPAAAIPYETFIDIDDQADLEDLLASQDITQETYDQLLDLLERGVDLSTASRPELYSLPNLTYDDVDKIIQYRSLNKGRIRDPADLVGAGALSQEKFLAVSVFLVTRDPAANPMNLHGFVRFATRWEVHDDLSAPPMMLRARFSAYKHLQAGVALTTTRLRIGDPVYDPARGALVAEKRSFQVHVPKAFVKWENDSLAAIVGSFRAGFGQKLIFDNSNDYTPNGLYLDDQLFYSVDLNRDCKYSTGELGSTPCPEDAPQVYRTPDFAWRDALFGVGVGAKKLEIEGAGWLQLYGWASASTRSIYQYELYNAELCEDPHDTTDACKAPAVLVRDDDNPLAPAPAHAYATLPNVFAEKLVGGNVTYFADRRNSIGITAYGATETNLVSGIALDFQEWSRYPTGRTFGAAGASFSFGRDWLDLFGEAGLNVRSVVDPDGMDGTDRVLAGGGPAAILRMTATRKKEELELVARYYDEDYANPYGRPIAQADEFEGQRARDEAGLRGRYVKQTKRYVFRALLDLWVPPSSIQDGDWQPKLETYARIDVRSNDQLTLGLWERYQDKDLTRGGHDQCFEVITETDPIDGPVPCAGRQLSSIGRVTYEPQRKIALTLQLQHQLLDDNATAASDTKFRQDVAIWGIALWHPHKDVRVRVRARYLDEAIANDGYLETSFSGLIDARFRLRERDSMQLRADTKFWLDDRASTGRRTPDPELQLWLSYEARL